MIATMCLLNVATILQGGPVILCSLPPKVRQVKEYIIMKGGHLFGAWTHIQSGRVGTWPLSHVPNSEEVLSEALLSTS